ncbi:glycosyltransferase [Pimelobacter simplex]|uniref:glycosyltransferase n=1 Tax=Nocardioides simplex TaxID=2045 RepID=UPI0019327179|nr:glycosyltransferase [Pimelobacter simplex]
MTAADWTLVTVTYNSGSTLRRCWTDSQIGDARWLVVDNASEDDSIAVAQSLGAEVIARPTNDGFGVANNAGLAAVRTPWVMFVNPDVTIPSPAGLDLLARTARAHDALVAPQLLNSDGSEQFNGRGLPTPLAKLAHRGVRAPWTDPGAYARAGFDGPTYVAWAIGAAVGGSTQVLRELGGWDERYFIYYEDHDLGLRSWAAGHPVVLDPSVGWLHEWQRATTRFRISPWRHELRSAWVFYRAHPRLLSLGRARRDPALRILDERLWRSVP